MKKITTTGRCSGISTSESAKARRWFCPEDLCSATAWLPRRWRLTRTRQISPLSLPDASHIHRFLIGHAKVPVNVSPVDQGQLVHGIASALDAMVGICHCFACQHRRFCRFHEVALNSRVMLLERLGAASKRAARTCIITEGIDPSGACSRISGCVQIMGASCSPDEIDRHGRLPFLCDPLGGLLHQRQIPARDLARLRAGN